MSWSYLRPSYEFAEYLAKTRMDAIRGFHGILSGDWKKDFKSKSEAFQAAHRLARESMVDFGFDNYWYGGNPHESYDVRARRFRDMLSEPTAKPNMDAFRISYYGVEYFSEAVRLFIELQNTQ